VRGTEQGEFVEFYARESNSVRRYARAILGGAAFDLDDVMQEAWTKAWRAWDSAAPERRRAWMFRIVRNCCLDRHRRRGPTMEVQVAKDDLSAGDDPLVARVEATTAVLLIEALSRPLRDTLYLRVVEERSYDEIASILAVPIGTVMSRLYAARQIVARKMGPR